MIRATVFLKTHADILSTLRSLVERGCTYIHTIGAVPNILDGSIVYKLDTNDACGSEPWYDLEDLLKMGEGECEEIATAYCACLLMQGKKAELRLIQIYDTVHVQVVCDGQVLDPSVTLGMPVPPGLETRIYDLDFKGIP